MEKDKKRKKEVDQHMMSIRLELYQALIYTTHGHLLQTDVQYFKDYAKRTGLPERDLKMIMNGTWNGTIPKLLALCQMNTGIRFAPKVTYINKNKKKAK